MSLAAPRVSKKTRECFNSGYLRDGCLPTINPGDTYFRLVVPPYGDDLGNPNWLTADLCEPCGWHQVDHGHAALPARADEIERTP